MAAASVAVAGSLLAACGGGGSSNSNKSGSGSSGVVSGAGQGARLTGSYPAAQFWAWVPDSMYPSDVSEVPGGLYTTGSKVSVNAKYDAGSASCTTLVQNASGPGFGEEAYLIDQGADSAQKNAYSYGMYEFASASQAAQFVKELAARFASCGSFTITSSSGASAPITMSVGSTTEAAEVTSANMATDLRFSMTYNGKTDVADFVFAADGNVVVFATSASITGAVSTAVDNAKVVQEILAAFTTGEASAGSSAGASGAASSGAADRIRVYSTDAVRAGAAR